MGKKESLLKSMGGAMAEVFSGSAQATQQTDGGTGHLSIVANAGKLAGRANSRTFGTMELDRIIPDPTQPREHFDQEAMEELIGSVKAKGVLSPLKVRWSEEHDRWIIIYGERRYRAAKEAGLAVVPCIFVEGDVSEADRLEEQIIENKIRQNLTAVEEGQACQRLMNLNGWTGKDLAEKLHLSPSSVSRVLAIIEELPKDVQQKVAEGKISPTAAYEITKLDSEDEKREVAAKVEAEGLSREDTVKVVREQKRRKPTSKQPAQRTKKVTGPTEEVFKTKAGVKVVLTAKKRVSDATLLEALTYAEEQIRQRITKEKEAA